MRYPAGSPLECWQAIRTILRSKTTPAHFKRLDPDFDTVHQVLSQAEGAFEWTPVRIIVVRAALSNYLRDLESLLASSPSASLDVESLNGWAEAASEVRQFLQQELDKRNEESNG